MGQVSVMLLFRYLLCYDSGIFYVMIQLHVMIQVSAMLWFRSMLCFRSMLWFRSMLCYDSGLCYVVSDPCYVWFRSLLCYDSNPWYDSGLCCTVIHVSVMWWFRLMLCDWRQACVLIFLGLSVAMCRPMICRLTLWLEAWSACYTGQTVHTFPPCYCEGGRPIVSQSQA